MKALEKLIWGAVDYAGLFPPAQLPLETVVKNFAAYCANNRRNMLGRLIVPAGRLSEFESAYRDNVSKTEQLPWRISALLPPPTSDNRDGFDAGLAAIDAFHQRQAEQPKAIAIVDAVEVKTDSAASTQRIADSIPDSINAFLEVDWEPDPSSNIEAIAAIAQPNIFAKIRTGGITENLIPAPQYVARFLKTCDRFNVGLKATAGLHHPLRGRYRLTYDPDASTGTMHGFVNVFVAACLAFSEQETTLEFLAEVLSSESAGDFCLGDAEIKFRDHRIDAMEIESIRKSRFTSFGSCSFDEPSQEIETAFQLAPA